MAQVGMVQISMKQAGKYLNGSLKRCFDAVFFLLMCKQNPSAKSISNFDLHFGLL
jgi:hypothetical protein